MTDWQPMPRRDAARPLQGLPPLVDCGECGRPWRTWDPTRRCPRCRDGSARKAGLLPAGGQLRELPGESFEEMFG